MVNKKKLVSVTIVAILTIVTITNVSASTSDSYYADQMARRSSRGLLNILVSPLDLLNSYEDVRFKEGTVHAMTYGILRGIGIGASRILYGLYEVGTFYSIDKNKNTFDVKYDSAIMRF